MTTRIHGDVPQTVQMHPHGAKYSVVAGVVPGSAQGFYASIFPNFVMVQNDKILSPWSFVRRPRSLGREA